MQYDIQPLFNLRCHHGEGPVWDPESQQFYWVDLMQGQFFIGDWASSRVETHVIGQPLGVLALREKGGVVMALRDGFFTYDTHKRTLEEVQPTEAEVAATRFNDGAVDPQGRFWAATMTYDGRKPIGNLYCLDESGAVQRQEQNLMLPNGMGWSMDRSTYFFADTERHVIYAYDYDLETGSLSNRRNFIEFGPEGFPDGLTVDVNDHLWVAMWQEAKISHFDEEGRKVEDIALPVSHPTSCCFGGPERKHLLITTSQRPLSPEQKKAAPLAGGCLMLETGTTGQREPRYKG